MGGGASLKTEQHMFPPHPRLGGVGRGCIMNAEEHQLPLHPLRGGGGGRKRVYEKTGSTALYLIVSGQFTLITPGDEQRGGGRTGKYCVCLTGKKGRNRYG